MQARRPNRLGNYICDTGSQINIQTQNSTKISTKCHADSSQQLSVGISVRITLFLFFVQSVFL